MILWLDLFSTLMDFPNKLSSIYCNNTQVQSSVIPALLMILALWIPTKRKTITVLSPNMPTTYSGSCSSSSSFWAYPTFGCWRNYRNSESQSSRFMQVRSALSSFELSSSWINGSITLWIFTSWYWSRCRLTSTWSPAWAKSCWMWSA